MKIHDSFRLIALGMAAFLMTSCAPVQTNYLPINIPDNSLQVIASDIAAVIAETNPAKKNRFCLYQDPLSKEIGGSLREKGYEIAFFTDPGKGKEARQGKRISYTVDWVTKEQMYIALTIDNSQKIIRTYGVENGNIVPEKTKIVGVRSE